ncbi:hypothetical protein R6Q59_021473 [Mikania micrantha]
MVNAIIRCISPIGPTTNIRELNCVTYENLGAIAGRGAEVASAKGVLNEVQGRGQLQDSLPKHADPVILSSDPDMFFYSGLVRSKSNLYPNTSRSGTSPLKQVNFLILDDNFVQGHINFLIFLTLVP